MARHDDTSAPARPTYAIRLGHDERRILAAAAGVAGLPVSAYVRRVAIAAARQQLACTGEALVR